MRKWVLIIVFSILVVGGAVLCAIRWQAWFVTPAEPNWTGDTIEYTFTSPTDSVETILVLGDIHNRLTRANYDTLAARVPDADLVLQTGDWMERGQNYYRQLLLREWTASALDSMPVITCPGNHEYTKGVPRRLSSVWDETFPHSDNGPVGVPGASYWLDIPQARIIVIDTNPLVHIVYLTRTLTWLRQTMYSAGDRYIIVMMHHPVLSSAKGRWNPGIYATFRYALSQADLVLAGHDHCYMRHNAFVVLNTSGKPKQQRTIERAEVTDTIPVYGVLSLHANPSTLHFTVYRLSDGAVIDSLYVNHD